MKRFLQKLRGRPSVPRLRRQLSDRFMQEFDNTVRYGPFVGYRIPSSSHWGGLSRPAMMLGLYEKEVQDALSQLSKRWPILVDIGAADGFFAVGGVYSGLFHKAIAFEMSPSGRRVIQEAARLNDVLNRVEIKGKAERRFISDIDEFAPEKSLIMMDIEGAEFDLLDNELIIELEKSAFIVEIHDFLIEDGTARLQKLIESMSRSHDVALVPTGARDLSKFPELQHLSDNERWLLCSEGRTRLMRWLIATPANESAA